MGFVKRFEKDAQNSPPISFSTKGKKISLTKHQSLSIQYWKITKERMITVIGSLVGRPWAICTAILVIAIGHYADFFINKAIDNYQDGVKAEKEKAQEIARLIAEEKARLQAEAEAKAKAEAEAKAIAEENARLQAEAEAKAKAEEEARLEAEAKAKAEAEEKARLEAEAEAKAKAEAEEKARLEAEAEAKTKAEAEEKARLEA